MSKPRTGWFVVCALVVFAACDDEPESKPRPTFETDAGADAADGDAAREGPQYAVISSDWSATSVSLLDVEGKDVADDYINSGSTETGLVTTLSGDVEMPTASGEHGIMVLIDRYKTDVITRIRLSDGEILGQVKTHTPASQDTKNAFTSNPHDYLRIADDTAWVTRNQPNIDPSADEIDKGDDLLRIDPSKMERTDERIDLSSLRGKGTRTNPDTGEDEEVDLYAHPSRMARVGNTLLVGLGRSAYDFSAVGPGTVAIIDLSTRKVTSLELDGLKSCMQVAPIPGASDRVLVGCGGDFNHPGETEGVAIVRVSQGSASVEKTWRLADHANGPALSGSFQALDANTVTAAANTYAKPGPDSVFGTLDLESGDFTQLLSIPAGQGTFGTPLYDASTKKLYVPDASVDADDRPTAGVHVLERDGADFHEADLVEVAKDTAMPARHVYPL